jgi:hypothetical protein
MASVDDKAKYGKWSYFVTVTYEPPKEIKDPETIKDPNGKIRTLDKCKLTGFALTLASFGTSGKNIYPSAVKIAERCGMDKSSVKRWRADMVTLGLFRETGGHHGRVQDLEIAMPCEIAPAAQVVAPVVPAKPVAAVAEVIESPTRDEPHVCTSDPWQPELCQYCLSPLDDLALSTHP